MADIRLNSPAPFPEGAARINWPSNTLRCGEAGESASRRGQHSNRLFHVLLGVSASDLVLRRKGRGLSGIGLIP